MIMCDPCHELGVILVPSMSKKDKHAPVVEWLDEPQEHDYPAAAAFLSLLASEADSDAIVEALRSAPTVERKAKDLLRASRLELAPRTDSAVRRDLEKVSAGVKLSPVLLVRGDGGAGVPLIVADGYHRLCASYHVDEDRIVACRIVDRR